MEENSISIEQNLINIFYSVIEDKDEYIAKLHEEFGVAKWSIRSNWFSQGAFPKSKLDEIHTFTINYINLRK